MKILTLTFSLLLVANLVLAQLDPYTDFETSDEVTYISTIKINANMGPYYLEGLEKTWVAAMKYQKEKGYITDYKVFVSDLPQSGDFNLITAITYANDAAARGSETRFNDVQAHMKSLATSEEERDKIVTQSYPSMRKIVGQYRIRELTFK